MRAFFVCIYVIKLKMNVIGAIILFIDSPLRNFFRFYYLLNCFYHLDIRIDQVKRCFKQKEI